MFFQISLTPGFPLFVLLSGGLVSLFYCVFSAFLVLRGFILKRPVTPRQITIAAWAGLFSCACSLLPLFFRSIPLNFWSALNFLCNLTFPLYFRSRRKPRAAVHALYIQASIYLAFLLHMVAHMQMRLLPGFILFQLIPACLLVGISLVVLVQSIRERKEPMCPPCASPPCDRSANSWPKDPLEEEESPEHIARWDQQAPPDTPEDDSFEELLPSDPQDLSSRR